MSVYSIDFPNDSPDGVFILSSITMPMIFLYIPRGKAKDAAASEEIHDKTRGVYILYGKGEIYVGQTKRGVDRIKDHEIGKDFWECALLMLAPPQNFDLNIISCLEAFAIERLKREGKFKVTNTQVPNYTPASYSERQNAMAFLEKFWFFTNFIGLRPLADFEPPLVVISDQQIQSQSKLADTTTNTGNIDGGDIAPIPQPDKPDPVAGMEELPEDNSELKFYMTRRKLMATMVIRDTVRNGQCYKEYVVLAGSQVDMSHKVINSDRLNQLRRHAIEQGFLYPEPTSEPLETEEQPPQLYHCQRDFAFSSSSAAANFVAGGSCSGMALWVTANGCSLGELYGTQNEFEYADNYAVPTENNTANTASDVATQEHDTTDTTGLEKATEDTSSEENHSSAQSVPDTVQDTALAQVIFALRKTSLQFIAQMVVSDGKYVVLKGSHIDLDTPIFKGEQYAKSDQKHNHERQQLLLEGAIVHDDSGLYVLKVDKVFDSPSSAANFVAGGQNNGKKVWKTPDGRSLGDLLDSKVTKKKSK